MHTSHRPAMHGCLSMLLTMAVLIAGCGAPAITPSPCPASVRAAEPPPGTYIDQRAHIDYDMLVPPGDPRRNADMAYARQVIAEPVLLEQIYYDATHGNQRAAWLVCELEATALSGGRRVARHVGSLRCRALGTCRARWDELPISRDTASGQRLLSVLAAGFRQEARKMRLEDELIANSLMVLVGARIAARASPGGPRPAAGQGAAPSSGARAQRTQAARGATASRILLRTPRNLQKFFTKHGADFGLKGNWNPTRAADASRVIHQHVNHPGVRAIQGTYRGKPVTHYLDPNTGLNVIVDPAGNFVSGWRLGAEQLQSVLTSGRLF